MPRFALHFEYDGAGFSGTQIQANERTLQAVLNVALSDLDGQPVGIRLASRLDQGVSAEHLVGDCMLSRDWQPGTLALALAPRLPVDVIVRAVAKVPDTWNAKIACTGKRYRYRIRVRGVRPVLDRRSWWLRRMDHPDRLSICAAELVGRLNLAGFASKRGDERDDGDPVRTYHSAEWTATPDAEGDCWTFRIAGDGFLYKQVRALVGAMVFVAQGRVTIADFRASVAHGWGAPRLGNLAPGEGLMLERAMFDPEPDWQFP